MTINEYMGCCLECTDKVYDRCGSRIARFWMDICETIVSCGLSSLITHKDLFCVRKLELMDYIISTEAEQGVFVKPKGLRISDGIAYFCLDDSHGK